MNPTQYRYNQTGEILKEPIDITHEVTETTWEQNWENYKPVAIVSPPDDRMESVMNTSESIGYKKCLTDILAHTDEYFEGRPLAHLRFLRLLKQLNEAK